MLANLITRSRISTERPWECFKGDPLKRLLRILRNPIRELYLKDVYDKLAQLEYRSFNRRFYAIEQVTEYLIGAQVPGDYLEFGVYQGTTFIHAYRWMSNYFKEMKFFAFDSFEGLPSPSGIDRPNGYSSNFIQGQFACSEEEFIKNLVNSDVDLSRVRAIKGWFKETLTRPKVENYGIDKIAVAWVDCDLYESTVPVLEFITPHLTTGSVIVFDDWRCFRNSPDFGEKKACKEWLSRNKHIDLHELMSFGWNGMIFTAEIREG
jgi:hypothetical protein